MGYRTSMTPPGQRDHNARLSGLLEGAVMTPPDDHLKPPRACGSFGGDKLSPSPGRRGGANAGPGGAVTRCPNLLVVSVPVASEQPHAADSPTAEPYADILQQVGRQARALHAALQQARHVDPKQHTASLVALHNQVRAMAADLNHALGGRSACGGAAAGDPPIPDNPSPRPAATC
jgi:hypothetical protein